MVNKQRAGGFQRRAPAGAGAGGLGATGGRQQPRTDGDRPRAPRKCANCGKEHEQRVCPHPAVARDQRACWTCGKTGHASRDCPNKANKQAIKAIEDQLPFFGQFGLIDGDGYKHPRRPARPAPRNVTLGDFVKTPTRNRFAGIEREEEEGRTITTRSTRSTRSQPAISSSPTKKLEWKPKKTVKTTSETVSWSTVALDSVRKSCLAKPKDGENVTRSEHAGPADRIRVAPLGECNAPRARTSVEARSAWKRQTSSPEGTQVCELEAAVMAVVSEYATQDDREIKILGVEKPMASFDRTSFDRARSDNIYWAARRSTGQALSPSTS